jgi:hypothetical protein
MTGINHNFEHSVPLIYVLLKVWTPKMAFFAGGFASYRNKAYSLLQKKSVY